MTIDSRSISIPTLAGMLRNSVKRSVRLTICCTASGPPSAARSASVGKIAVASDIPNSPTGNIRINQAKLSAEIEESPTSEPKKVSAIRLICAAASPSIRGPISRSTSRTAGSRRLSAGRMRAPTAFSAGS